MYPVPFFRLLFDPIQHHQMSMLFLLPVESIFPRYFNCVFLSVSGTSQMEEEFARGVFSSGSLLRSKVSCSESPRGLSLFAYFNSISSMRMEENVSFGLFSRLQFYPCCVLVQTYNLSCFVCPLTFPLLCQYHGCFVHQMRPSNFRREICRDS